MDDTETTLFIIFICAAAFAWFRWYFPLFTISDFISPRARRLPLLLLPLVSCGLLFTIMTTLASHDVRENLIYILFYVLMGAAWLPLGLWALRFFGLSAREDVVERRNRAALFALSGALVALTLCYAGGNIGDGPGWWAVVHSAGLATVTLFVLLALMELITHSFEMVTIDRDDAAGIRLAGLLIGMSLILARAAAGNWFSFDQMDALFVQQAWVVVALVVLALVLERVLRPTAEHPVTPVLMGGIVPALVYVGVAAALLAWHLPQL